MRPWIEKLALLSKKDGFYSQNENVWLKNINWTVYNWSTYKLAIKIYNDNVCRSYIYKIYEDEFDLLKEATDFLEKQSEDYIITYINDL